MRRLLAMMRYDKKIMIAAIALIIDVCLVFALGFFDVVQLIQIKNNAATLSSAFVSVNIVLLGLAVVNILAIIGFIIFKRRKEKLDEFKQD